MGEDVEGFEGAEGLVVAGVVVEDGVEDAGAGVAVEGDQGEAAGVAGHKYAGEAGIVAGEAVVSRRGDGGEASSNEVENHAGTKVRIVGTETEYGGEMCKEP